MIFWSNFLTKIYNFSAHEGMMMLKLTSLLDNYTFRVRISTLAFEIECREFHIELAEMMFERCCWLLSYYLCVVHFGTVVKTSPGLQQPLLWPQSSGQQGGLSSWIESTTFFGWGQHGSGSSGMGAGPSPIGSKQILPHTSIDLLF